MPEFTISYVTCPQHDPSFCNQCAEDAYFPRPRIYKVTFNCGPHSYRPTSSSLIIFETLAKMLAFVTKWETDSPLYMWSIQSINEVEDKSKPIVNADYWMEDN